jgi:regulator of protease activity HflC (stomatin/prohibitin superfamily)
MPYMVEWKDVSTSIDTQKVEGCNVPDATGSPIVASAVFNYYVVDAIQATYGVDDLPEYLNNNAQEVVKSVCQLFPMSSKDPKVPSLRGDASLIGMAMRDLMQQRVKSTGVKVVRMELMEVSYAAEVATAMLQVQQAQAKIDARELTVAGSVAITALGLMRLAEQGHKLPREDADDLS